MASEAVLILETETPVSMTCALATGIEKGAILMMTSPMTAVLATGDGDIVAGICAKEHIANTGTTVSVYRGGIFRVLAGASGVTVGVAIDTHASTGATNEVAPSPAGAGQQLGVAMETVADTNTFLMELKPRHFT